MATETAFRNIEKLAVLDVKAKQYRQRRKMRKVTYDYIMGKTDGE